MRPYMRGASCDKNDTFRGSSKENSATMEPRKSISFFSSRLPVRGYSRKPQKTKHRHSNTDISSAREDTKSAEKPPSKQFVNIVGAPEFLTPFQPVS